MKAEYTIERNGKTVVLFAGLLASAHEQGLKRVTTTLIQIPNTANNMMAITHAQVETARGVFDGIGDASPDNVGRQIAPHIIRMSETRAVARAFRLAINIGEALADDPASDEDDAPPVVPPTQSEHKATKGTPIPQPHQQLSEPAPEWPDAATVPTPRERWMAAHQALSQKGHPPTWKLSKAAGSTPLPEEPPTDLSEAKITELAVQLESRLADLTARPVSVEARP